MRRHSAIIMSLVHQLTRGGATVGKLSQNEWRPAMTVKSHENAADRTQRVPCVLKNCSNYILTDLESYTFSSFIRVKETLPCFMLGLS